MCGRNMLSFQFFPRHSLNTKSFLHFYSILVILSDGCTLPLTQCQNVKAQHVFSNMGSCPVFVGKLLFSFHPVNALIASLIQTKLSHLNIMSVL